MAIIMLLIFPNFPNASLMKGRSIGHRGYVKKIFFEDSLKLSFTILCKKWRNSGLI